MSKAMLALRDLPVVAASSIVARTAGIVEAEINEEVVALSIERGICYGLNPVGSRIWNLLAAPIRVAELCATLVSEYNVDIDVCERETLDLLEELRAEGLITIVEQK
jgi:hypothetical protein